MLAGSGLLARPSRATVANAACPAGVAGALVDISRPIAPVGITVRRDFVVRADRAVSDIRLSAPATYNPQQLPANNAFSLRFRAPQAGPFDVQGTWSTSYTDENGATQTCSGSGSSTLTAGPGSPLKLTPPPAEKFPGVAGTQYGSPLTWTWRCKADSDPIPPSVTVRWEVDMRPLPLFSKGGNAPFRFTKRSRTFTVKAGDACDARQIGGAQKTLIQGAKLQVTLGGSSATGGGSLVVLLRGGFRNPHHNKAPFHLGLTFRQGSRTPLNEKLCAWYQSAFLVARGKGISCWW